MRAATLDLISPHPLGEALPAVYQDDNVVQRLTVALDQVIAPIVGTLDNIAEYFDPRLTPDDFIQWLGSWVGLALDEEWPLDRHRALIAGAVELHRWSGTATGIKRLIAIYTGTEPDIEDSGGVGWSPAAGGVLPGTDDNTLTVRLSGAAKDLLQSVDAIVGSAKPAHVLHRVEVTP